jgi:hypothetical protein
LLIDLLREKNTIGWLQNKRLKAQANWLYIGRSVWCAVTVEKKGLAAHSLGPWALSAELRFLLLPKT